MGFNSGFKGLNIHPVQIIPAVIRTQHPSN